MIRLLSCLCCVQIQNFCPERSFTVWRMIKVLVNFFLGWGCRGVISWSPSRSVQYVYSIYMSYSLLFVFRLLLERWFLPGRHSTVYCSLFIMEMWPCPQRIPCTSSLLPLSMDSQTIDCRPIASTTWRKMSLFKMLYRYCTCVLCIQCNWLHELVFGWMFFLSLYLKMYIGIIFIALFIDFRGCWQDSSSRYEETCT